MKQRSKKGFTLIELLVVIAIIGLLMGVLAKAFEYAQTLAWQARSQELVSNVATSLGIYIQRNGSWPDEILSNSGGEVNNEVCKVLQQADLLDVTTIAKFKDDGSPPDINQNSPERFGLFSPWGQRLIRKNPTMKATLGVVPPEFKKHILQFRVDVNLDGKIDSEDGQPGTLPEEGKAIRASVIVWSCGPLGKADGTWGAEKAQDNRQSWGAGR